jgi:hypothetical protein
MQFKPITAITVLSLVVASLLVSGCTISTTPTTTPNEASSEIAYLQSYLLSQGYTMTSYNKTEDPCVGCPAYHLNLSKGDMDFSASVMKTDGRLSAMREFNRDVNWSVRFGFVGDYINATSWQGTMTDKGTLFTHAVIVIDDKWVVTMFCESGKKE